MISSGKSYWVIMITQECSHSFSLLLPKHIGSRTVSFDDDQLHFESDSRRPTIVWAGKTADALPTDQPFSSSSVSAPRKSHPA